MHFGRRARWWRQCDALSKVLPEIIGSWHLCECYFNFVVDAPLHATVFLNCSGLFPQDNAPCHTARIVQKWSEEPQKKCLLILQIPQIRILLNICGMWQKKVRSMKVPRSNLQIFKRFASYVLVPDTTGHFQRSCEVQVSRGFGCFGGTIRTYTVLGRWFKCYVDPCIFLVSHGVSSHCSKTSRWSGYGKWPVSARVFMFSG